MKRLKGFQHDKHPGDIGSWSIERRNRPPNFAGQDGDL
jgi:hypothetical protein